MTRNHDWSAEDRKTVLDMWAEGKSASDISREMPGRTRNSVLGVIHRTAGVVKRTVTRARPAPLPPPPPKIQLKAPEPVATQDDLLPWEPPIFTADLDQAHCRWPYDSQDPRGYRYCGGPRKCDSPYCEGHARIASIPNKVAARAK